MLLVRLFDRDEEKVMRLIRHLTVALALLVLCTPSSASGQFIRTALYLADVRLVYGPANVTVATLDNGDTWILRPGRSCPEIRGYQGRSVVVVTTQLRLADEETPLEVRVSDTRGPCSLDISDKIQLYSQITARRLATDLYHVSGVGSAFDLTWHGYTGSDFNVTTGSCSANASNDTAVIYQPSWSDNPNVVYISFGDGSRCSVETRRDLQLQRIQEMMDDYYNR
jgi:hypothetical protein